MSLSGLLNQTASHYSMTQTTNEIGATRSVPALVQSFACRIAARSAYERQMSGSVGVMISHRLYCSPLGTAIGEADEIRVGTTVYDVIFVNNVDAMSHHWQIDLAERRPDRHGR